jgi:hypothetical protein
MRGLKNINAVTPILNSLRKWLSHRYENNSTLPTSLALTELEGWRFSQIYIMSCTCNKLPVRICPSQAKVPPTVFCMPSSPTHIPPVTQCVRESWMSTCTLCTMLVRWVVVPCKLVDRLNVSEKCTVTIFRVEVSLSSHQFEQVSNSVYVGFEVLIVMWIWAVIIWVVGPCSLCPTPFHRNVRQPCCGLK